MVADDLSNIETQLRQVREKYREQAHSLSPSDAESWSTLASNLQKVVTEMDQLLQRNSKQMNVSFLLNHESSSLQAGIQPPQPLLQNLYQKNGNDEQQNHLKVKLDRTAFYSENSPFQHQMDRSGSFRLCPPLAHTSAEDYFRNDTQTPIMISDGQILENLANLKRLTEMQRQ
ncbi:uncharacterized protein KLLA0_E16985g [Kluyveromyces lactis]|uniref:KLLA0E16985p n=1 Tax=Kluyveromyces lactis (strain ATCC 8585 / CBS 2359 / DSM 70799 / NBRC 1267 / NRRL Y-1140 / WM37) TaxID=284590 RepID=Q6CMX4_KLULA|nr:uncharacterized protein KLLA0_E16985g [Kluyveromyces lactis]CAG99802.1 KLLA0E16985p [Kluyveromyces lactis]|eukprot:XP_454715.1 uncharacterized protein KLLA0_E16985g [Kluyveromyces lactis]